jgi:O-antigen ligase
MFHDFILKKKFSFNILFFLSLVASLIPLALIIGALIAEVLIFFLSVFFIYFIYLKKIKKNYFDTFAKFLFLFWLYLFIKSLLNHEPSYSIIRSFFYFRYIFFAILIAYLITYYSEFRKIFFYFITATLTVLVVHAYAQHLFNIDLFYLDFKNFSITQNFNLKMTIYNVPRDYRISGLFYSESILGSFLSKLLPLYIALLFYYEKKSFFYVFLALSSLLLIIISGERAAIAVSLIFIILLFITISFKFKNYLFVSYFLVATLIVVTNPNVKQRMYTNTVASIFERMNDESTSPGQSHIPVSEKKINIFSLGHQGHILSAIQIFNDNKLFGIGIKGFRYECKKDKYFLKNPYACTTHPHNTYFQLLAETGIFGFLFVFFFYIYLGIVVLKFFFNKKYRNKEYNYYKVLVFSLIANLFPLLPSGSFFNNWISITYFLTLAFFMSEHKKINSI